MGLHIEDEKEYLEEEELKEKKNDKEQKVTWYSLTKEDNLYNIVKNITANAADKEEAPPCLTDMGIISTTYFKVAGNVAQISILNTS